MRTVKVKTLMNVAVLAGLALMLQTCSIFIDNGDDPNPQTYIEKTWTMGSGFVKKAGTSVTSDYTTLTMTFNSDGRYTTTGGGKLFKPSGTWAWVGDGTAQVKLDGDLPVDVSEVSENTLHFTFTLDAAHVNANGRAEAMVGAYDVLLSAQ